MTITFRIDDGTIPLDPSPAVITPDQLGALRELFIENGARLGITLLLEDADGFRAPAFSFEARVCPLALASLSVCFDHDPGVIAVIDEAHFSGRRIRVSRVAWNDDICLSLSVNLDAAPEMEVANAKAFAILAALGLDEASKGTLAVGELRRRLSDPTIFRRLEGQPGVAEYVATLRTMAMLDEGSSELTLAWA